MTESSGLAPLLAEIDSMKDFLESVIARSTVPTQIYRKDGRSAYVNPAFMEMFGVAPPSEYCVLEDEIAEKNGILPIIQRAFDGESVKLPLTWYDPGELKNVTVVGGKKVAMESRAFPVFNRRHEVTHVVFTFHDVTLQQFQSVERQKVLKQLNDANSLVRDLLNETKAVIYFKDTESRFLLVNKQFETIFNLKSEYLVGKSAAAFLPAELAEEMRANDLAVMKSGIAAESEEVARHHDGDAHTYISLKFPLRDSEGEIYGVCGISTDISNVRRVERELSSARRMEALGVLAGGVAHDFNNILGVIIMHADGLKGGEVIKSYAERASELTRKLLAFGQRESLAQQVLDLNLIIEETKEMLTKIVGADIDFELDLQADLIHIKADRTQIEQILMNLCLNARDAMAGGGRLEVKTRRVLLDQNRGARRIGSPAGNYVQLSVKDSGHGIAPEVQERIFEPFFSTKEKDKGTGLGLSSVYGILQQCGGDIEIASQLGEGAVFKIYLPVFISEPPVLKSPKELNKEVPSFETILIIDDEEALREITAEVLRKRGFTVYEAAHAVDVERLLRDPLKRIDLVMTDVIMPDINGPMLIANLEKKGLLAEKKVLFVSGYSDNKLESSGISPDRTSFLLKPYSVAKLIAKIREILDSPA